MEEIRRINDSELNAGGGAELAPDGQGATLRNSITGAVLASVSLPVIGQVVDLKGSLELQTDVRVE